MITKIVKNVSFKKNFHLSTVSILYYNLITLHSKIKKFTIIKT